MCCWTFKLLIYLQIIITGLGYCVCVCAPFFLKKKVPLSATTVSPTISNFCPSITVFRGIRRFIGAFLPFAFEFLTSVLLIIIAAIIIFY